MLYGLFLTSKQHKTLGLGLCLSSEMEAIVALPAFDMVLALLHISTISFSLASKWTRRRVVEHNKNPIACKMGLEALLGHAIPEWDMNWCEIYKLLWVANVHPGPNRDLFYYVGKVGCFNAFRVLVHVQEKQGHFSPKISECITKSLSYAARNGQRDMVMSIVTGDYPLSTRAWGYNISKNISKNPNAITLDDLVAYLEGEVELLEGRYGKARYGKTMLKRALNDNVACRQGVEGWWGGKLRSSHVCWSRLESNLGWNSGCPDWGSVALEAINDEDVNTFHVMMELNKEETMKRLGYIQEQVHKDTAIYKEIQKIKDDDHHR